MLTMDKYIVGAILVISILLLAMYLLIAPEHKDYAIYVDGVTYFCNNAKFENDTLYISDCNTDGPTEFHKPYVYSIIDNR